MDPFTAVSAGLQVLGAGANIIQGISAKRAQREAEERAARALSDAKKKIEVNRMEGLQVPLDAYGLQTQAMLAAQQQSMQGLRESGQRALQSGVQGTQLATQQGFEQQRQQMAQDIYNRDKMIAQEEGRIAQQLADINLQEVAGAQAAAAQREQQAAQSFTGAIQGLAGAGQTIYENSGLYNRIPGAEKYSEQDISNLTRFGNVYGEDGGYFNRANPFSPNSFNQSSLSSFKAPGFNVSNTQRSPINFIDPSLQFFNNN